jgi:hypothetical protein
LRKARLLLVAGCANIVTASQPPAAAIVKDDSQSVLIFILGFPYRLYRHGI